VIPLESRMLIQAEDEAATVALFRATAGLDVNGEGRIVRPGARDLRFLAERPYLAPGSLRAALVPARMDREVDDEQILGLLDDWDLETLVARAGGLDSEQDWDSLLSLAEQQRLACVRILLAAPRLVLLDRPATALGSRRIGEVLDRFSAASIGYLQLGGAEGPARCYESVLQIHGDGRWNWLRDRSIQVAKNHRQAND